MILLIEGYREVCKEILIKIMIDLFNNQIQVLNKEKNIDTRINIKHKNSIKKNINNYLIQEGNINNYQIQEELNNMTITIRHNINIILTTIYLNNKTIMIHKNISNNILNQNQKVNQNHQMIR